MNVMKLARIILVKKRVMAKKIEFLILASKILILEILASEVSRITQILTENELVLNILGKHN